MKTFKLKKDIIKEMQKQKLPIVIYGAGKIGRIVSRFLCCKDIPVAAFVETKEGQYREVEGRPVYCIDSVLAKEGKNNTILVAVNEINREMIVEELKKREITEYYIISDFLYYEMIKELLEHNAEKIGETEKYLTHKNIGYLGTEYLGSGYAQERLIINKVEAATYCKLPWETAKISFMSDRYEENVLNYAQLLNACYRPEKYLPDVDLIHTFNTVCDTNIPWCASFETTIPRVWPQTGEEKNYYLELIECMKRPSCKTLYALCKNAYEIQKDSLSAFVSSNDVELLMKKTKVLHPPQKILVTEDEFEKKHNTDEINFIFIGRGFFTKGGREMIQVLSEFEDQYSFSLTLISSMAYNDYFTRTTYEEMLRCKRMIQEKSWIDFHTILPNNEVLEKCKKATVGLLPSVAETYGYAVLEMQAAGCPVVTTNIRAFPEINNEECGWICHIPINELGCCKENDARIWSEWLKNGLRICFQDIFRHPESIRQKGRKALERIRTMHDPEKYQQELKNNLQNISS